MARQASGITDEERAFLQQRVTLFWKVLFVISCVAVVMQLLALPAQLADAGFSIDHGITLMFGGLWLLCRRGRRSTRFLLTVEAVGLGGASISASVMGRYVVREFAAFLSGSQAPVPPLTEATLDLYASMLVLSGGCVLFVIRAAVVPSPPARTLALTALIGLPYILIPHFFGPADPGAAPPLRVQSAVSTAGTLAHVVWWSMVSISAAAISHVIYGLRAEVRRARQLGQYALEGKLGEGGMGVVYRARHGMMRRPTAVKLLKPELTGETSLKRFEREVQLTARLTHPHTITIFDYGRTPDGVFYYAMELLDGASLGWVVATSGRLPASRVVHVLHQVGAALTEAHDVGLIHRDIKPANIILCRQGGMHDFSKVVDFGLVKELDRAEGPDLTQAGAVAGTPLYLPPEAITSPGAVDARADLYSLGAVGYFALTGTPVFHGKTFVEVCGHHLHTSPEPPSRRLGLAVPEDLETLILDCLAKDPEGRPAGAAELCRRLEACGSFGGWTQRDARAWWAENPTPIGADGGPSPTTTDPENAPTALYPGQS